MILNCNSAYERQLPKLNVVGSIPIARSNIPGEHPKQFRAKWVHSANRKLRKKKELASSLILSGWIFKRYTRFSRSRNFPRYAYRAARVLQAPDIRRQISGHMSHFKKAEPTALEDICGAP